MTVPTDNWVDDFLTISRRKIPVKVGFLRQNELKFYPENPRIYSIISSDGNIPGQSDIERKLADLEHVKRLVHSIRANGGLIDPLIVRDGDYVVLEGNSRLAAYRILSRFDAIQWGKVKVQLLPKDIPDELVFALLGKYHIIGRKDWAPYEQAGYLYRQHKNYGIDPSEIAKEMGLGPKEVGHLINVYSFMVKHNDNNVTRWSFYDEYIKSRDIRKAREGHSEMDKTVVRKIKTGEIREAIEVRKKLKIIAKASGSILNDFLEKEGSFNRSYERASARGYDNEWYNRLHKFREFLLSDDARSDFSEMEDGHRKKCVYELKKINEAIEKILKRIK